MTNQFNFRFCFWAFGPDFGLSDLRFFFLRPGPERSLLEQRMWGPNPIFVAKARGLRKKARPAPTSTWGWHWNKEVLYFHQNSLSCQLLVESSGCFLFRRLRNWLLSRRLMARLLGWLFSLLVYLSLRREISRFTHGIPSSFFGYKNGLLNLFSRIYFGAAEL